MSIHDLIFYLFLAVCNSFVIIGWNRATEYDTQSGEYMVLWKLRKWSIKKVGVFWTKPLFGCCTCMSSVHSTYIFIPLALIGSVSMVLYIPYILMLAGVVTFINNHS